MPWSERVFPNNIQNLYCTDNMRKSSCGEGSISRYIRPSPMNFKSSLKKLKYELCILSIYSMRTTTFRVPNNEMITTALVHGSRRMSDGLLPGLILYYYSTTAPFSFERGAQKARGRQYNKKRQFIEGMNLQMEPSIDGNAITCLLKGQPSIIHH